MSAEAVEGLDLQGIGGFCALEHDDRAKRLELAQIDTQFATLIVTVGQSALQLVPHSQAMGPMLDGPDFGVALAPSLEPLIGGPFDNEQVGEMLQLVSQGSPAGGLSTPQSGPHE